MCVFYVFSTTHIIILLLTVHAHMGDRWRWRRPRSSTYACAFTLCIQFTCTRGGAGTNLQRQTHKYNIAMSLPKLIHAEFFREPLPPDPSRTSASDGGGDPLSGTSDAEISHIQAEPENQSSTAGPFHRFSNATAAVNRQAAALPRLSAGGTGDGSSDGRLTGGGDGESENAGEQTGISHASGISVESTVNCGKTITISLQLAAIPSKRCN